MKNVYSISLYWKCQLVGWGLTSLYWGYLAMSAKNFDLTEGVIHYLIDVAVGIFLTHLYRNFALKKGWERLDLNSLILRMVPVALVLAALYMILIVTKLYLISSFFEQTFVTSYPSFVRKNGITIFMTGLRLMSVWLLAYHIYHYSQREMNIVKENSRLSIIAKEAQLNNLASQLNPHFFFNSLNTIKFFVNSEPETARRAIDLLSDLLRNALYVKDDRLVPIHEEVQLVNDFLELEKLRFEERLQISVKTDEQASHVLIPPLSIQALVENAIKHGIDRIKNGGCIEVNVKKAVGYVNIEVKNPGNINGEKQQMGLGLKNLEARLRLQFNGKAKFSIENQPPGSVLATLSIPLP